MNANELADKLEKDGEGCTCAAYCAGECACDDNWAEYHTKEAATMLRQQQVRIDQLLETQDYLYKRHDEQQAEIEALKARIERMIEDRSKYEVFAYAGGFEAGKELKTLTDEEIDKIADMFGINKYSLKMATLAILRKAQSNCNGFCGEYECKENQVNCKRKAQEK